MAKKRKFLNFEISDELRAHLDEAAKLSRWDRSKQARRMLEHAFGIEPKPYLPTPPSHDNPRRLKRP